MFSPQLGELITTARSAPVGALDIQRGRAAETTSLGFNLCDRLLQLSTKPPVDLNGAEFTPFACTKGSTMENVRILDPQRRANATPGPFANGFIEPQGAAASGSYRATRNPRSAVVIQLFFCTAVHL